MDVCMRMYAWMYVCMLVWYGMVWYGMVWYGMWCGVVWMYVCMYVYI